MLEKDICDFEDIAADKIPGWLNTQLFYDCLKPDYPSSDFSIKISSIKPAVGAGENYLSSLYRVKVEVHDGNSKKIVGFIIKCVTDNEKIKHGFDMFDKELLMYSQVLTGIQNEYKEIGEDIQFGPKLYKYLSSPNRVLILEDLNSINYSVQNRCVGLDLEHSELFYKKLAKFHAASVIYHQKHGDFDDHLFLPLFHDRNKNFIKSILDGLFPYFLDVLRSNENLCYMADKFESWMSIYFEEICKHVTDQNSFNVLCHADVWINNMLFSHDTNNKPTDIILIDYQICCWSSPIYDLYYFFISSTETEVKAKYFDHLIQCYHTELVANLKKLQYTGTIPTLRDLHIDLLRKGFLAAILIFQLSPASAKPTDESNMDNLMDSNSEAAINMKKALYNSPKVLENIGVLFKLFGDRGLLDLN